MSYNLTTLFRNDKTAVIIPALNEGVRIAAIIASVVECDFVDEIVVVSDGSTDNTVEVARAFPQVIVVDLPYNIGKGGAMCMGVAHSDAGILCFIDADLVGLESGHIEQLLAPVLHDDCEMCMGVFRGGKFWSDTGHVITPFLSGQRAMRRELFEAIPFLAEIRMGAEVTIHTYAKKLHARMLKVVLSGVSNTHKENKMGFVRGAAARAKMYSEIAKAVVRVRSTN